ncbi:MAG: TonB family protein, partial [Spirochaetales bacterium]|nr:TonB family protein [Spirochaetales bacterium]
VPEPPKPAIVKPKPVPKPEIIKKESDAVVETKKEIKSEPEPEIIEPQIQTETEEKSEIETSSQTAIKEKKENFLPFYKVEKRPEFIHKANLQYPIQAKKRKIEGTVIIEADIDSKGILRKINIAKSAGFGFDEAASKMISESTFKPAYSEGKPVAVRMRFTIVFKL